MTGLIILAAGASSRMGFPKQTLLYKGKTLLELAIEAGLKSRCKPVCLVLGANAEAIQKGIQQYEVSIIHNPDWAEGMGSSIKVGLQYLQQMPDIDSVVIMLCDQPFVTRAVIDNLLNHQQQTGKKMIASTYNSTVGVPAMFHKTYFPELLSLQGHDGAKKILSSFPDDVALISFEKGGIDIDSIQDYEKLIKGS